eukprot:518236-Hanusia_phi.AAC.1
MASSLTNVLRQSTQEVDPYIGSSSNLTLWGGEVNRARRSQGPCSVQGPPSSSCLRCAGSSKPGRFSPWPSPLMAVFMRISCASS